MLSAAGFLSMNDLLVDIRYKTVKKRVLQRSLENYGDLESSIFPRQVLIDFLRKEKKFPVTCSNSIRETPEQ